jgi:hypothetical protein
LCLVNPHQGDQAILDAPLNLRKGVTVDARLDAVRRMLAK